MSEVVLVVLQRWDMAADLLNAAQRCAGLANGAHISVLALADSTTVALEAAYEEWAADAVVKAFHPHWHASHDAAAEMEERGGRADLIVIARPTEDDDRTTRQVFRAVLLKTGRPVLVVPPGWGARDFGRRVAIAWRHDEHTAKAVVPALRYIAGADRVFLLAGLRAGAPTPEIPGVLSEHGVSAELHLMPIGAGPFGEVLLAAIHERQGDLLIMGAYANNALHNLLYGGVTQFMLSHADFPVLMRY